MKQKLDFAIESIRLALDGQDITDNLTDAINNIEWAIADSRKEINQICDHQHDVSGNEIANV